MKSLKRLFKYLAPNRVILIFILFFTFLFSGLDVYTNVFVEGFLDKALVDKNFNALIWITMQYITISTLREISEYILDRFMGRLSSYFILRLRKDFYNKLVELPYKYFSKSEKSDLISKFINDGERCKEVVEQVFHSLYHAFTTIIFIIVMLYKHVYLTLGFLLIVPGMLAIIKIYAKKIIFTGKRIQEQLATFVTTMKDFLSGIRIIKVFGTEKIELKKFDEDGKEYFKRQLDNVKVRAGFEFLEGWLMFLSLAAIAVFGGYEVTQGRLTLGTFTFFFVALGEVHENISDFIEILGKIQTYLFSSDRVFSILDIEVEKIDKNDLISIPKMRGSIRFDNVCFKYDQKDDLVLKNINFEVKPGEVVAIVGKSGSGKSTIANLILGLYEPTSGDVRLDNRPMVTLNKKDVNKQLGFVPQETFLFADTIANNIAYGTKFDIDQIERAAQKAFVTEFSDKMPYGLNTVISEDGSNLSGGQKQRISIARAIVRNPRILVLDEATSSLDAESSQIVTEAIFSVMSGITTVIITHKVFDAVRADKIIVVNEGKIVEIGDHDTLIKQDGIYSLWAKQQSV
jgi:ABC-type multidrug transport system fused ATPase/permease subunit